METGTVKFFTTDKGYGFIVPDLGGKDVFVHVHALEDDDLGGLNVGDRVQYETEPDQRSGKMRAAKVRLLSTSVRVE